MARISSVWKTCLACSSPLIRERGADVYRCSKYKNYGICCLTCGGEGRTPNTHHINEDPSLGTTGCPVCGEMTVACVMSDEDFHDPILGTTGIMMNSRGMEDG